MDTPLLNPTDIRQRLWMELQRAPHDRHHEWRTPVLATVSADGLPQARTVVLRQASAQDATLQIYTDSRSPKVAELTANPRVVLAFWSKRLSWQLRVQAVASVQHSGPTVDAVWAKVSQSAAAGDYLSANAPGDVLPEAMAADASGASEPHDHLPARQTAHHLAIITAHVQSIDWLELARSGHRRGVVQGENWQWCVP